MHKRVCSKWRITNGSIAAAPPLPSISYLSCNKYASIRGLSRTERLVYSDWISNKSFIVSISDFRVTVGAAPGFFRRILGHS